MRERTKWPSLMAGIQADTLILARGSSSHVPQRHLQEMAATIPMAQLVTIGGGHMIHDSRPDEFAAAVLDHFAAAQRT